MQKFDVQIAFEKLREAKSEWAQRQTEFTRNTDAVVVRLLHEGARCFMSAEEMARASGLTVKRVRTLMRANGLDPRQGKRVLSDSAAKALNENAALMGIKPHEMDLTSPLAYLPMGQELRRHLTDVTTSQVTELPEVELVSGNEAILNAGGTKCDVCRLNTTVVDGVCVSAMCPSHHVTWCRGTCDGECWVHL